MPRSPKLGKRTRTSAHAQGISRGFGRRLKFIRAEKGMAQDTFAELLGVSRTTASNIERGVQRVFLDQVFRASEILEVSLDELLPHDVPTPGQGVRAASDDPLTTTQERRLKEIVQELSGSGRNKRKEA